MSDFYKEASATLAEHDRRIINLLPTSAHVLQSSDAARIQLLLLAEIAHALRAIESAIDVASYGAGNR